MMNCLLFWKNLKKGSIIFLFLLAVLTYCSGNKTSDDKSVAKKPEIKKDSINWSNNTECCSNLDKYPIDTSLWQPIKYNFYKNKKDKRTYYLTCSNRAYFRHLEHNIDFETYKEYGQYAMDKDSVYCMYRISDGELVFQLEMADRPTFDPFKDSPSVYAKDKNNVYCNCNVFEGADVASFEPIMLKNLHYFPLARDKNHVYEWDEIVSLEGISEIKGLKEYLDSLKTFHKN